MHDPGEVPQHRVVELVAAQDRLEAAVAAVVRQLDAPHVERRRVARGRRRGRRRTRTRRRDRGTGGAARRTPPGRHGTPPGSPTSSRASLGLDRRRRAEALDARPSLLALLGGGRSPGPMRCSSRRSRSTVRTRRLGRGLVGLGDQPPGTRARSQPRPSVPQRSLLAPRARAGQPRRGLTTGLERPRRRSSRRPHRVRASAGRATRPSTSWTRTEPPQLAPHADPRRGRLTGQAVGEQHPLRPGHAPHRTFACNHGCKIAVLTLYGATVVA